MPAILKILEILLLTWHNEICSSFSKEILVCSVISSVDYPVCKPSEHAPSVPKPSSSASTDGCYLLFIAEQYANHPSMGVPDQHI